MTAATAHKHQNCQGSRRCVMLLITICSKLGGVCLRCAYRDACNMILLGLPEQLVLGVWKTFREQTLGATGKDATKSLETNVMINTLGFLMPSNVISSAPRH